MLFQIPYYKKHLDVEIEDSLVNGVLTSHAESYKTSKTEEELVREAINNRIACLFNYILVHILFCFTIQRYLSE